MKQFIKKRWPWIVGACILIAAVVLLLVRCGNDPVSGEPTLIVETPQKLSVSQTEEFTLDVTISNLGDARYPAMSMSIAFDPSRLEFLGVEEGNIFILSDENSTGQKLPADRYKPSIACYLSIISHSTGDNGRGAIYGLPYRP